MKRIAALALCALLLAAVLAGCGSAARSAASTAEYAVAPQEDMTADAATPEAGLKMAADPSAGTAQNNAAPESSGGSVLANRKLVKSVDLALETREFDKAVQQIGTLVTSLGGYMENSSVSGQSLSYRGDYFQRYASFTARVPVDQLDQVTQQLGTLCNVTSRSENVSDITDSYYDVDGRLKALRVEESRLLALMEKAEKLEDMLTIEQHLSDVRYQIEDLTGQKQRYDSQVSYSTVTISLQEVAEYSQVQNQPETFGKRVADAFHNSLRFIKRFAQALVLFLVTVLPFALVYGAIAALVVWLVLKLVRRLRKNSRPKSGPPKPPAPQTPAGGARAPGENAPSAPQQPGQP